MKRTPLKRKTPLRSMSPKRAKVQRQRREMVRDELAKRELCEAGARIRVYQKSDLGKAYAGNRDDRGYRCGGLAVDLHEPLTRARGGDILDPANTFAVCRICHEWIHAYPKDAVHCGLLVSSSGWTGGGHGLIFPAKQEPNWGRYRRG